MKIKIGISPCPNDTFIFEHVLNTPTDVDFELYFEDVETLNKMAQKNELDIVKISYANYFNIANNYELLRAGGALGKGVGPILISKNSFALAEIFSKKIAIPGLNTTAFFLLKFAFPEIKNFIEYPFHKIEEAVLSNEVDAGVIIHENRFTFEDKGLKKIIDLGAHWEEKTQLPIPLGGIAIKRTFDIELKNSINELIKNAIQKNWKKGLPYSSFILDNAQEMKPEIIQKHIELYVNEFSIDVGTDGEKAVVKMQEILAPLFTKNIFIQ
ncbi:MAG: 1,4-dihydroxy-6-naphthoate synthase [Chitinophagaceae bacterium]|nr:1,4-dihydroxy-6-naphthoate synthase [Chitinophagaceae bacterium]